MYELVSAGSNQDTQSSSWLGSITSLLLRTLFNVSIVVQNVVVKHLGRTEVATLTCHSIQMHTATDGWQATVDVSYSPQLMQAR